MIYVTQGHPKGIGLEVFFKSIVKSEKDNFDDILLIANRETIEKNLRFIYTDFNVSENEIKISNRSIRYINVKSDQQSLASIEKSLDMISEKDILLTLPTSKDQFVKKDINYAGHTEFFRKFYNCELTMFFWSPEFLTFLLTDHIPLSKVTDFITEDLILEKTKLTVNFLDKVHKPIDTIYFSGINPHCGENGILGYEDKVIEDAVEKLKNKYPLMNFLGPLSGDTLHTKRSENNVCCYAFHDQGLSVFKALSENTGANITCGLPFIRLSVDHGTAFDLYGKNKANFKSMLYCLDLARDFHSRVSNDH